MCNEWQQAQRDPGDLELDGWSLESIRIKKNPGETATSKGLVITSVSPLIYKDLFSAIYKDYHP